MTGHRNIERATDDVTRVLRDYSEDQVNAATFAASYAAGVLDFLIRQYPEDRADVLTTVRSLRAAMDRILEVA